MSEDSQLNQKRISLQNDIKEKNFIILLALIHKIKMKIRPGGKSEGLSKFYIEELYDEELKQQVTIQMEKYIERMKKEKHQPNKKKQKETYQNIIYNVLIEKLKQNNKIESYEQKKAKTIVTRKRISSFNDWDEDEVRKIGEKNTEELEKLIPLQPKKTKKKCARILYSLTESCEPSNQMNQNQFFNQFQACQQPIQSHDMIEEFYQPIQLNGINSQFVEPSYQLNQINGLNCQSIQRPNDLETHYGNEINQEEYFEEENEMKGNDINDKDIDEEKEMKENEYLQYFQQFAYQSTNSSFNTSSNSLNQMNIINECKGSFVCHNGEKYLPLPIDKLERNENGLYMMNINGRNYECEIIDDEIHQKVLITTNYENGIKKIYLVVFDESKNQYDLIPYHK